MLPRGADTANREPYVPVIRHLAAKGSNTGRDAVEQPDNAERDGDRSHAVNIRPASRRRKSHQPVASLPVAPALLYV